MFLLNGDASIPGGRYTEVCLFIHFEGKCWVFAHQKYVANDFDKIILKKNN